jgi:hypothetical protein
LKGEEENRVPREYKVTITGIKDFEVAKGIEEKLLKGLPESMKVDIFESPLDLEEEPMEQKEDEAHI